jgi:hypothetical protein
LFTAIVKRIYAYRERMRRCNKEHLKHHAVSACFLLLHPGNGIFNKERHWEDRKVKLEVFSSSANSKKIPYR